ncbi:hypothetical protein SERLA73DRAFT_148957 [Serpula lacrymans var. lacrymans S7.3]|uniref:Uncharacterized protein n=1 Tax=Serpula lacrymans var. lacrymans (strain S7.3) TaxID=936435 RepID=F8PH69_SERL3|nr:hypothetical protein SERLA73DRAFT_148957 [Serpula lacrymans var. lacrymans S7.3]
MSRNRILMMSIFQALMGLEAGWQDANHQSLLIVLAGWEQYPVSDLQYKMPVRAMRSRIAKDTSSPKAKGVTGKVFENQDIDALTTKHNTSIKQIKALAGFHNIVKKSRAPNIFNVLVHAKALEINPDLPSGEKMHQEKLFCYVALYSHHILYSTRFS